MGSAEADEVPLLVRAAGRTVLDVVSVRSPPAAARDLAQAPIALEDPLLQGIPLRLRQDGFPDLDEVRGDPPEAFARR
jgi:hypothetical protein